MCKHNVFYKIVKYQTLTCDNNNLYGFHCLFSAFLWKTMEMFIFDTPKVLCLW